MKLAKYCMVRRTHAHMIIVKKCMHGRGQETLARDGSTESHSDRC